NWTYRTTGHLFQDRFRSENVETSTYLLTVTRYIHQNPVKAAITTKVDEWKWSSCLGYYGQTYFPGDLLDGDLVLRMFSVDETVAQKRFKAFNEELNHDQCLEDRFYTIRKTDDEARMEIKHLLGEIEIAHVK